MCKSYTYDVPQLLFSHEFVSLLLDTSAERQTLVISANAQHARWLSLHPRIQAAPHITVRTLQSTLIHQLNSVKRRTVLSALGRSALVQSAWQTHAGELYRRYGMRRGAVAEIGRALSWISQQRHHWRDSASELDMKHELAQIYQHYVTLMDTQDAIGYDDVALHVCDMTQVLRQHDLIVACELQHATPAQLTALARILDHRGDDMVCAWVDAHTAIPELQYVHQWLCQFSTPEQFQLNDHPAYDISRRILGHATATCTVSMIGESPDVDSWYAGASTGIDECQTVARLTSERLADNRRVDIVCADESILPQIRAALALYGIDMPPLKPSTFQNPLIRLARSLLHWHQHPHNEHEQNELLDEVLELPVFAHLAPPQRQQMRTHLHHTYMASTPMHALAPQLDQLVRESRALAWVWAQSEVSLDIADTWIRDYTAWIERIREVDRIVAHGAYSEIQRIQLVMSVDALPPQIESLYRTTLPLFLHSRIGAADATDCVIIMGLSEHVAPRQAVGYQLFTESWLCATFREQMRPLEPALSAGMAWREREARRMARLVGHHAQECILTFAYHANNGQAQLPSAYFERILQGHARFTRDGTLEVNHAHIRMHACTTVPADAPVVVPTQPSVHIGHSQQFSSSQMSTYMRCPRRYFYEKVLRLGNDNDDETDERALDLGSLVHEILCAAVGTGDVANVDLRSEARAHTQARWAHMPTRVRQIAQAAWHGDACQLAGGGTYTPTQAWRNRFSVGLSQYSSQRKLLHMCERWLAVEPCMHQLAYRRPILLEQTMRIDIGGFVITGRIDRIDEIVDTHDGSTSYHIIDYKSSKAKSANDIKKQFLPDNGSATNYQIPIYLYGTRTQTWQHTAAAQALSLFFLNSDKQQAEIRTVAVDATSAHETASAGIVIPASTLTQILNNEVVPLMHQMQHYPYPTKPDRTCSFCPYTLICDDSTV